MNNKKVFVSGCFDILHAGHIKLLHRAKTLGNDLYVGIDSDKRVKKSKIFQNIENNSHMYFVHSYEFIPEDKSVISATTDYSSNIVCSVEKENIFGTQFHPEKSDRIGLKIIDNFINL